MAAAILQPYVRPEVTWIVQHHGLFQNYYYVHHLGGDRDARDRLRGHPWYEACVHFCAAWDQCSFDPDYPSESLEYFEPLVRRIFTRAPHDPRYQSSPV
jgi:predicted HD phosphohydrolase